MAGLLILPGLVAWIRPRFITRYERSDREDTQVAAAPARTVS